MSVPNIGPELPDDHDAAEAQRKGNPAPVYRDEPVTDEVRAASTRASAVSHRFGGVRYALTGRDVPRAPQPAEDGPDDGGESDTSQ
jgi:hypothetical protein